MTIGKTQISTQPLPKVQILSKTGQVVSETYAKTVDLNTPGTIVKLSMDKSQIIGSKKVADDLIIIDSANNQIVIKNFFQTSGSDVSKLVLDDNGELYVSSYDSPFNGLNFSSVDSVESIVSGETAEGVPSWVLPVVGVAALGGVIAAIASNNHSSGGSSDNSSSQPSVQDILKGMNTQLADIDSARAALQQSINDLQIQTANGATTRSMTPITITAGLNDEPSATTMSLKPTTISSVTDELVATTLDNAATTSENTPDVGCLLAQHKQAISDAKVALEAQIDSYQKSINAVESLLESLGESAKTQDVLDAIAAAKALLTELETDISNAEAAIAKAETILEATLAANQKVVDANAAMEKAQQDFTKAQADLDAARQAMKDAVASNDLSKVDEINKQIVDANAALDAAKASYNDAISKIAAANSACESIINSGVTADYVTLNTINESVLSNPNEALASINSSLEAGTPTVFDVIKDFLSDSVDYFKALIAKHSDTTLGGILQDAGLLVDGIVDSIIGKILAPCQMIGSAINAIKAVIAETVDFGTDVVKLITSSIYEAITGAIEDLQDIVGGAIKGVTDAIAQFVIGGDWLNPANLIQLAFNAVKNAASNVIEAIVAIPGSAISSIISKVTAGAGDLWDCISAKFSIITDAVSDIFTIFFDNFVKSTIIWPVISTILNIVTHPVTTVKDLIESFYDLVNIGKDIIKIPGDLISGLADLISDIIGSFGGNEKVVVVDELLNDLTIMVGELAEAQESQAETSTETSTENSDAVTLESILEASETGVSAKSALGDLDGQVMTLEYLISEGNSDIDLDNVVTETDATEVVTTTVDAIGYGDSIVAQLAQVVLQADEDYSAAAA